MQFGMIQTTRF